jgi:hypothetical protein
MAKGGEAMPVGGYKLLGEDLDGLDKKFTYHPPHEMQISRYAEIRAEASSFARLILLDCPRSRELSLALTKIEEAVFWANAAIARNEDQG